MAKAEKLMPIIQKWEGGYSNHKNDNGGCTMKGITISAYRKFYGEDKTCSDLKNITDKEWLHIFQEGYWNPCKADEIDSQIIANIIVDWAWMSGVKTAVKKVQKILNVDVDGVIGKNTLYAINKCNEEILFNDIYNERVKFYTNIVEDKPSQKIFLNGWLNRLNDIDTHEMKTVKITSKN